MRSTLSNPTVSSSKAGVRRSPTNLIRATRHSWDTTAKMSPGRWARPSRQKTEEGASKEFLAKGRVALPSSAKVGGEGNVRAREWTRGKELWRSGAIGRTWKVPEKNHGRARRPQSGGLRGIAADFQGLRGVTVHGQILSRGARVGGSAR